MLLSLKRRVTKHTREGIMNAFNMIPEIFNLMQPFQVVSRVALETLQTRGRSAH